MIGERDLRIACIVAFFGILVVLAPPSTMSQRLGASTMRMQLPSAAQNGQLSMTITVGLSGHFSPYSTTIKHALQIELAPLIPLTALANTTIGLLSPICGLSPMGVWPSSVIFRSSSTGCPGTGEYSIQFLQNMTFPTLDLTGFILGIGFLWRNPAEIPVPSLTSSYSIFQTLVIVPPTGTTITSVFSEQNSDLEVSSGQLPASRVVIVNEISSLSPVIVIYQPSWWDIFAVGASGGLVGAVAGFTFYWKRFSSLRVLVDQSKRFLQVLKLNSRQILVLLLLIGSVMVSVSLMVGPDPRPRVYVLTVSETQEIQSIVASQGGVTITPADQNPTKLASLTEIGSVDLVVVGDFPLPPVGDDVVLTGLSYAPRIALLQSMVDQNTLAELQQRFPIKTAVIPDTASLAPLVSTIHKRASLIGLSDSNVFVVTSGIVGIGSFVLAFFALAFLSMRLLETGSGLSTTGFAEAIGSCILVFVFSESVYVASGALLGVPIGLHASTPGGSATAIGLLGLGGGSKPRAFAGLLGFVFGALCNMKNRVKLNAAGVVIFIVAISLLIADPLTGGMLFYQVVSFFATSGPTLQLAQNSVLVFKSYLSNVAHIFGAFVSPIYTVSTGVILYYAFAIPFSQYSKLRPATGTFLFLASAFATSDGFIRIAEQEPWKIITTIFPGTITAFVIALVFHMASRVEAYVDTLRGRSLR